MLETKIILSQKHIKKKLETRKKYSFLCCEILLCDLLLSNAVTVHVKLKSYELEFMSLCSNLVIYIKKNNNSLLN